MKLELKSERHQPRPEKEKKKENVLEDFSGVSLIFVLIRSVVKEIGTFECLSGLHRWESELQPYSSYYYKIGIWKLLYMTMNNHYEVLRWRR